MIHRVYVIFMAGYLALVGAGILIGRYPSRAAGISLGLTAILALLGVAAAFGTSRRKLADRRFKALLRATSHILPFDRRPR